MGFICLYVLIQKSGQKTAKSHLCSVRTLLQRLWLLADTAFDGNVRCADGAA